MKKEVVYSLFTLTFLARLCVLNYILVLLHSDVIYNNRHILLKIIIIHLTSYTYIIYIMLTKNILQLRLYKIFVFINIVVNHCIFTHLNVHYNVIQAYNILLLFDILIEIYSVQAFYHDFMLHYIRKKGMCYISYKRQVKKQKMMICLKLYIISRSIDVIHSITYKVLFDILLVVLFLCYMKCMYHKQFIVIVLLRILYDIQCIIHTLQWNKDLVLRCFVLTNKRHNFMYFVQNTKDILKGMYVSTIVNDGYETILLALLLYFSTSTL